jgi:hypothetical protein
MTRLLYSVVRWFLTALPVDDAGRRVFDETLADWRRDAASATGRVTAAVVTMRSLLSVIRSVAGVSAKEVVGLRHSGVVPRLLLWMFAYVVVVNVIRSQMPGAWPFSTLSRAFGSVPLAAYIFPVALLLAAGLGGRHRRSSALGLSMAAVLVAVPLLGWGVPWANRAFHVANPPRLATAVDAAAGSVKSSRFGPGQMYLWATTAVNGVVPYSPLPFVNDVTAPQLVRKVLDGPAQGGWSAIQLLSFFGAYVTLCALMPVFAGILRDRARRMRYGLMTITACLLLYQRGIQTSFGAESVLWWFGMYWVPVAWIALCLCAVTYAGKVVHPETAGSQIAK